MGQVTSFLFPFETWRIKDVRSAVAKVRRELAPHVELKVDTDDGVPDGLWFRAPRRGNSPGGRTVSGRLDLRCGEDGSPAALDIDHHEVSDDDALELADDIARLLCHFLKGRAETDEWTTPSVEAAFDSWEQVQEHLARAPSSSLVGDVVSLARTSPATNRRVQIAVTAITLRGATWITVRSPVARVADVALEWMFERTLGGAAYATRGRDRWEVALSIPLQGATPSALSTMIDAIGDDVDRLLRAMVEAQIASEGEPVGPGSRTRRPPSQDRRT